LHSSLTGGRNDDQGPLDHPQLPQWEEQAARSPWFGNHFNHAAKRVEEWLLAAGPLPAGVLDFGYSGAITTLSFLRDRRHGL